MIEPPCHDRLDHHRRRAGASTPTSRCRPPAAARGSCCSRRSSASTSTSVPWPSSTRWTVSSCSRPMCSGSSSGGWRSATRRRHPARPRAGDGRRPRRDCSVTWPMPVTHAARAARGARPRHRRLRLLHGRAAGLPGRRHGGHRRRGGLLRRRHPGQLERRRRSRCPIQFHYGALDANIPLSAVDRVRAAMPARHAEVHVYTSADHGFNCWARGSYHAPSAALAHGRALQFLATKLF